MNLRRGFKTEAEWYAQEMRRELKLKPHDPLCPWRLAAHLEIEVVKLSALATDTEKDVKAAVRYLMSTGSEHFSAVTIFPTHHGRKRVICANDSHAATRQSASISHELTHALLGHRPKSLFEFDKIAEDEAHWMGPALLVSDKAATQIAYRRISVDEAAKEFGVSSKLMQMRLNVTGAMKRLSRWSTRTA